MLQIQDTLVSLDLVERFFCCDISKCHGQCCIDGDAGAPITKEEEKIIKENLNKIIPFMRSEGVRQIETDGVSYIDEEGDLVTTIVDGRDCAFTCRGDNGECLCAIEKLYRAGQCNFIKPVSCHLYPVRITEYPTFTAVNYHRWDICCPAEELGKKLGLRLYKFLREPLIRRFGQEWYDELDLTCETYIEEYLTGQDSQQNE